AAAGAYVPAGYPVVWGDAGAKLQLLSPAADERQVRQLGAERSSAAVRCQLTSPFLREADANPPRTPQVATTALSMHGLYRGQQLERQTQLALSPLAAVIRYQSPLPRTGSVAVRASSAILDRFGSSGGAIAIVLDCSGSMGPPAGQAWSATTKYNEALQAL